MAFSLNKVMLIGNLGKDAETRFTNNNLSVTNFTVATTHSFKNSEGNWANETTWHNVVSYNLSDYNKENLKKGAKVYVEGRYSKKEYTDKGGIKRYWTEVITERIIPLDTKETTVTEASTSEESNIATGPEENEDLPF